MRRAYADDGFRYILWLHIPCEIQSLAIASSCVVWGIMVAVIEVAVVVVKVRVWSINIVVVVEMWAIAVRVDVVIATLFGLGILVGTAVVIAVGLVVSTSFFAYVLSDVAVGALIDALARVIMSFVSSIGVEVLADANTNVFASLMPDLEFAVPNP